MPPAPQIELIIDKSYMTGELRRPLVRIRGGFGYYYKTYVENHILNSFQKNLFLTKEKYEYLKEFQLVKIDLSFKLQQILKYWLDVDNVR